MGKMREEPKESGGEEREDKRGDKEEENEGKRKKKGERSLKKGGVVSITSPCHLTWVLAAVFIGFSSFI